MVEVEVGIENKSLVFLSNALFLRFFCDVDLEAGSLILFFHFSN
jgi:hypothetical protein